MPDTIIDAGAAQQAEILALNEQLVHFLSPLHAASLQELAAQSALYRAVLHEGKVCAFLIAVREDAAYASVNYRWFCEHYARFLYVDRIVVAPGFHHMGIGSQLYREVFAYAGQHGIPRIAAEIDIRPMNDASLRFHEKMGFREVGRQPVAGGKKEVSLQIATLL